MRFASFALGCLAFAAIAVGCGSKDGRGGPANVNGPAKGYGAMASSSSGDNLGTTGSGGSDCSDEGACGTETHTFSFDAPNLYFVFDASGSMSSSVVSKIGDTRYDVVRYTATQLVDSLGPLINVGAAIFPGAGANCYPGGEVMPVSPGDPFSPSAGPTLSAFKDAINVKPEGGTPTAATLEALVPTLAELKGHTVVLLLTDGGPNCNSDASCGPSSCMPVIEGDCSPVQGCCGPGYPGGGPRLCVDRDATVTAIEAVHALGIDVYVIGVADLALYQGVLNDMAVAGGVPNASGTKYTEAKDLDKLGDIFATIAAKAISCELTVKDPPTDKGFTNVYFGCSAVPFDAKNGWAWSSASTITLYGESCAMLKAGKVEKVKIVTGCPTEMPK